MGVAEWLSKLGFGQYARGFAENDIDFDVLPQLTDADLKELGVGSLGHRKRLLAAIAEQATAYPASNQPTLGLDSDERRHVTIIFVDLCGFTALSQSLDPEEMRELIAGFTARVDGIVAGYGGTVDKHIGDAVMALFGAPLAHDDDPTRAVRTALDVHAALASMNDPSTRPLQAHIGIASGEVVAGSLGRGDARDYTVMGDSVNLAARLVALAAPGETLLSEGVYRALSGRGICEELGDTSLKGLKAPVRVWRLHGLAGESAAGTRTSFVGRAAEIEQFKGILSATVARSGGQIVYVRGEAGIGKTRLVEEMRRIAEENGFSAHRGLVLDFGVGKGQDAVRALLLSLLGLSPASGQALRQEAAERLIAEHIVPSEQVTFLHDLLELPQTAEGRTLYDAMDNAARNRGKRSVAAAIAARACRRKPTLMIVEDLHWADSQVLGHLAAFAAAVTEGPGLLIMTSRVEGDPIDTAWRAGCRSTPLATIDLGPLRRDEAISLAGNFVAGTQHIATACVERAGGNPLFLEQLLRNAKEGSVDSIPPSIQSVVLARMDRLSSIDRRAFQAASVIGQRFDLMLLRHLIDMPDYVCDRLVTSALLLPEGDEFLFAHALIQEGAYSSLLRSQTRELHRRAAQWFVGKDQVLHAQHLDRAEDERAANAYLAAAGWQRANFHVETALRLARRGLEIARTDTDRHALMCMIGELQHDLGKVPASIATYREAATAATNDAARCRAWLGLADGLRVNEGLTEAIELLRNAQELAERGDMIAELARLHHLRGNIFFALGNVEGLRQEHELSFDYARRIGSPEAEARALGGLADAAYAQGRMRSAFEYFSRCVTLSRAHGFGRIEVANRSMVGFSRIYLGEARQARQDGDAAARSAALVGQPRAEMLAVTMSVFACYELADYEAMKGYLERVTRLARQLGARRFEAQALELDARRLLDQGRRAEAAALLREALSICREAGTQFCGPKVLSALSRAVDDSNEVRALLVEGKEMLERGSVGHNHLWFYRDAIEAFLCKGDAAGALEYVADLENYARREPLAWSELFAQRGRALARAMCRGAADDVGGGLLRVRSALCDAGFEAFLPLIDATLAR
ncbi:MULTISPECIES: adenylate/guanylate cyclase domain-containing protein [unclassified Bradyrhizobium]